MGAGLKMVAIVGLTMASFGAVLSLWATERMFWLERRIGFLEDRVYGVYPAPRLDSASLSANDSSDEDDTEWTPLEHEPAGDRQGPPENV